MAAPTYPLLEASGGGSGDDKLVKVTISDTTAGYLGSKIAIEAETPITLNVLDPGANEALEFELDGDQVPIDWVPTTYVRNATPAEAGDVKDLTAHLKGIDDELTAMGGGELNTRLRLEKLFNSAYDDHYTEFTYTGDNLTKVEIWEDNTKALKLFTRDLTYTGENLTGITTTDELTTAVLTTTLFYTGDNLTSRTRVVT